MYEINLIDKSFDKEASGNYSVSIQANSNGLTYCICDKNANSYILFRKHRFDNVILQGDLLRSIREVMEADETLKLRFSKVKFMGYVRQSALVPRRYFDRNNVKEYLRFNHAEDVDGTVFNNLIDPPGFYNLFSLPDKLVSLVTLHFKKAEFLSQGTAFLRHISNQPEPFIRPVVYLGLNPGFFDIACTGEGKLMLYNTFEYSNETDLLYYVLFVYKQLGFETEKIPLMISGELSPKQDYIDILRQYIPGTGYDEATCTPLLAPGLTQLVTSGFLNLLNIHVCESSEERTAEGK